MDKLRGLYNKQKRSDSKGGGSDGTASLGEEVDSVWLSEDEEQPVEEEEDSIVLLQSHIVVKKKKKSVRFSPITRVVCFGCFGDHSADNREALWYTSAELSHNKRIAKHFISCSRTLLFQSDANALSSAFYTAHSLSRNMDCFETDDFLLSNDSSLSTLFASFITRDLTRGLEDSLCPNVADARNALARESRLIVLELQDNGLDDDTDDNGHHIMVANEYQDLSRTSLILARFQGMADAYDVGMLDTTATTTTNKSNNMSNLKQKVHVTSKAHHHGPEENIHLTHNNDNNIIEV